MNIQIYRYRPAVGFRGVLGIFGFGMRDVGIQVILPGSLGRYCGLGFRVVYRGYIWG